MADNAPEKLPNTGLAGMRRLRAHVGHRQCVLGIDSGKLRWGIAISDDALRVSMPLLQHERTKYLADLDFVQRLVSKRNVAGIVVGLPLHMNGQDSPRAQAARQLARDLEQHIPNIITVFWDERMSSVAMSRAMIEEADLSRKKQKKSLDKLAANFILQGALESLNLDHGDEG